MYIKKFNSSQTPLKYYIIIIVVQQWVYIYRQTGSFEKMHNVYRAAIKNNDDSKNDDATADVFIYIGPGDIAGCNL